MLTKDWDMNWRAVGTKVTELNEKFKFPWDSQLWYITVAEAAMAAELSTKQTFQILENLEATHLSGAYGQQGEGIQNPTGWALERIKDLNEDELVRKLNADFVANRRAKASSGGTLQLPAATEPRP